MTYNLQGRLATVINESFDSSGTVTARNRVTYQYDASGIRSVAIEATDANLNGTFASSETTGSTEYLTDLHSLTGLPQTLVETTKNAASQTTERITYVFGTDELTQTVTQLNPTTGAITSSETHTFGHDAHASVRMLIDATGALLQAYTYAAFGELLAIHNAASTFVSSNTTDALTSQLYSGESTDSRTGQQYLRNRWYRPEFARFDRDDSYSGDREAPFSLNKYSYTSGDPIRFGDPTGMFDGLIGTMMAMSNGMLGRGKGAASNFAVLQRVNQLNDSIVFIQKILQASLDIGSGNIAGAIASLTGFNPTEILDIQKKLSGFTLNGMSLSNLAVSALAAAQPVQFQFDVPDNTQLGKLMRKLARLLPNRAQELIGEVGTWLVASLIGFKDPGLTAPRKPHGLDLIVQHSGKPDLWAIFDAKGGTSRLSNRSTLQTPAWPSNAGSWAINFPAQQYKQMGAEWIEWWIRHTIVKNLGTGPGTELISAFGFGDPFVTGVVSVNLNRNPEFKLALQVFIARDGLGFGVSPTQPWPTGF